MHRHDSPDWTAHCLGINQSRLAHGEPAELERFAGAVGQSLEQFAQWSVRCAEDGKRTLRGNEVTIQLHYLTRRLCPACIAESQHHRFWWDLRPITTCPRHQLCLIDTCVCGSKLKWRDPSLLHCDQGRFFANLPRLEADPMIMRADRYLLARFGCAETEPVAILDEMNFVETCNILERIGAADVGFSRKWRTARSLGVPVAKLQARGFEILADNRLDELLTRTYDEFIANGGRPEQGFSACYGWLFHWFNYRRRWKGYDRLAEAMLRHGAARFPIVPRAKLGTLLPEEHRKLSLKQAAARIGVSTAGMRSIGLALDIIKDERTSGHAKSFPSDLVDRLARDMTDALSLEEAMDRLGIARRVMIQLIEDQTITPALDCRGQKNAYVFRRTDVDKLLTTLAASSPIVKRPAKGLVALSGLGRGRPASVAQGVRLILDGHLTVSQRKTKGAGLQGLFVDPKEVLEAAVRSAEGDLLSFATAANKMRINSRGLRRMIDFGLLAGVPAGATELPADVAARFSREFIMMGEIRDRIGGSMATLRPQLERAGFPPDDKLARCLLAGYPRERLEAFLAQIETGEASLEMPDPARNALIAEARRILKSARKPVETDDMIGLIRRKTNLGPSDQPAFFFTTMNEEKAQFVFIVGAGWWLRSRPFLGRVFSVDEKPSYHDFVEESVLEMIRTAKRPLSKEDIAAALRGRGLAIAAASEEVFLRKLTAKHRAKIARLVGLGYWDRMRPYGPALYNSKLYPTGIQTLDERIAACVVQHLTETRSPASRADLISMLARRGAFDAGEKGRSQISRALLKSGKVVWLPKLGYGLKGRRYR